MALDNYANLRQAIKKWTHREDIDEHSEDCILEAEQEMFYGQVPFRLNEMITEDITAESAKVIAYPADMLELTNVSIQIEGIYYRLQIIPKAQLSDNGETGCPKFYSMTNQIELDVEPNKSYNFKIEYYKKVEALSDDNPTNIILQKFPLAYKFGSMASAFMYAGEEQKADLYAVRMRDVVSRANTDANNFLYGANPTQFIDGVTP